MTFDELCTLNEHAARATGRVGNQCGLDTEHGLVVDGDTTDSYFLPGQMPACD